ncbi:batten's disease protein Cln3 [Tilletiaria anomala UBC 951]|uniref:Protein BTN n=1 Tax=Tilletiaria anomala (strain ATCC 24038 / CBS 436.72 / UBC 951) TaxID=1037660 RepID=A0A066W2E8_TILAU|nr:batten's disease protein Cln3 [Tilletiaria anomala UBC 951]KDN44955.1 batten's disease protein Cln3 [Tilletiaria anomala UBC 951]
MPAKSASNEQRAEAIPLRTMQLPLPDGPGVAPDSLALLRLSTSFFLFGLLNNSLYVVILTAALELLPKGVPTGVVAFANIFPALIAKVLWPYVLKGRVRYTKRIWSCSGISFVGMLMIAMFPKLTIRLTGIALASFSSGLGELTYLQLATRYKSSAGHGVGWFASGTGAAGLVGALTWWIVRPLGVRLGLSILSILPWFMIGTYLLVLPSPEAIGAGPTGGTYAAVPTGVEGEEEDAAVGIEGPLNEQEEDEYPVQLAENETITSRKTVKLAFANKMTLLRPMLFTFILPLVMVYFFEYTINQGAPTLLYPLPKGGEHPLLSLIIKKLSDYYPLYQLTYQTFVFLSRSSISVFRLPAIPKSWLWAPAFVQGFLLVILTTESLCSWFRASIASPISIVLVCVEGLAGGYSYVSVFYQIGTTPSAADNLNVEESEDPEDAVARAAQEHEFRIGCVGVGDSFGILLASLVAIPLELQLCHAQLARGRMLCQQVE